MSTPVHTPLSLVRRIFGRIVFWIIAILLIWWTLAFFFQRKVLFPRHAVVHDPGAVKRVRGIEQVWIESAQGPVEGWFSAGVGVSKENPGPAVIFTHGNAELIDNLVGQMDAYRSMGISVLLPEYRGYGISAGSPSQQAISEDMLAFHHWLVARPEVDTSRIIHHGRSLGGGAILTLAGKHPPSAVILESTFQSARARMKAFGIPGFLSRDPFDNLAVVEKLDCPILLFHGEHDTIIPHGDSVVLQAAAKKATLITLNCGHNDLPPDSRVYWAHIESFLRGSDILR